MSMSILLHIWVKILSKSVKSHENYFIVVSIYTTCFVFSNINFDYVTFMHFLQKKKKKKTHTDERKRMHFEILF